LRPGVLAGTTAFIGGVVGWVDLTDPAVGETVAALLGGNAERVYRLPAA
jgi:hypothetical protein